jgi:hypothetical protein
MDPTKKAKLIANVLTAAFTKSELLSYHKNVSDLDGPEELLEAIQERLRRDFPAAANAAFGKKSDEAMEILTRIAAKLDEEFDLSKNSVKSHVKVGGYEQTGEHYLCRYISYKNEENLGIQLTLSQLSLESEMFVTVGTYRTNASKENFRDEQSFALGELEQAVEKYRGHLSHLGARALQ